MGRTARLYTASTTVIIMISAKEWLTCLTPIILLVSSCSSGPQKSTVAEYNPISQDVSVENYRLGRFSISVPVEMKQVSTEFRVYYTTFEEFLWANQVNHTSDRLAIWDSRLASIKAQVPPRGINDIVIETLDFSSGDRWAKSVFYYGNRINDHAGYWDVLLDGETVGVWIKVSGTIDRRDNMVKLIRTVLDSYHAPAKNEKKIRIQGNGRYYLSFGAVNLPFKYREEVYSRFEGHPLDPNLKLSVKMEVVAKVEESNLIDRLSAAMMANFVPGLSIDKIRTTKREIAGLKGEEVVIRGTEDGNSNLSFSWRYPGKPDLASNPEILIKMETKDGDLEEKLKLWDSVLDSLKPL